MVAAFDYCLHGKGGAAPSIDTAMHGLVDAVHVDHLHPDSGIAFATAADGEALTRACFGDRVGLGPVAPARVPARPRHRRDPAHQPGGDRRDPRRTRDHGLGRHVGGGRGELAGHHPDGGAVHRRARQARSIRAASWPGMHRSRPTSAGRARRTSSPSRAASPPPIGRRSATSRTRTSSSTSWPARPTRGWRRSGTSCPDHFLRTKVRPLVLDLPPSAPLEEAVARLRELHAAYRDEYRAYYERHATPDSPADARRGSRDRAGPRRRDVLVRREQADRARRRRVLRQRDQRDARRRGALHLRAHRRGREVPDRVLGAGGGEAAAACPRPSRSRRGSRS